MRVITVFETFSQVFLSLNTALLVNAEHISSTPLKLCKHREISATAAHFSMAATLLVSEDLLNISDATNLDTSLNRFVIRRMLGARVLLSLFIQAWPKNSLGKNKYRINIESFNRKCQRTRRISIRRFDDRYKSFVRRFLKPTKFRYSL